MRLPPVLVLALVVVLVLVAALADRALVGRAEAIREAAALRIDDDARLAVRSAQATLGQIEQSVIGGSAPRDVAYDRLALPPPPSISAPGFVPYGERGRAELAELLSSDRATPNGLPEAVVARIALGPEAPVSGADLPRPVGERLLAGELPVRSEDLTYLASRLGLAEDPRIEALRHRLRAAPRPADVPVAPAFSRQASEEGRIEGWARLGDAGLVRYEMAVATLLEGAGIADRARMATGEGPRGAVDRDLTRVVDVPQVPGLRLQVQPNLPDSLRLAALRVVLWLSAALGALGLLVQRRALEREARAVAR